MSSHKRGRVEWWSDENTLEEEFSSMSLLPPSKRKIVYGGGRDDFSDTFSSMSIQPPTKPKKTLHDLAGVDGVSNMVMQFLNPKDLAATSRVSKKMGVLAREPESTGKAWYTLIFDNPDKDLFDYVKFGHTVKHIVINSGSRMRYLTQDAVKYFTNCESVHIQYLTVANNELYFPISVKSIKVDGSYFLHPAMFAITRDTHPFLVEFMVRTSTRFDDFHANFPDAVTHLTLFPVHNGIRNIDDDLHEIQWPKSINTVTLSDYYKPINAVKWPIGITCMKCDGNYGVEVGDSRRTFLPPYLQRLQLTGHSRHDVHIGTLPSTLTHLITNQHFVDDHAKFPAGLQVLELSYSLDANITYMPIDVWSLPKTMRKLINVQSLVHTMDGRRSKPDGKIHLVELPNLTDFTVDSRFRQPMESFVFPINIKRIAMKPLFEYTRSPPDYPFGRVFQNLTNLQVLQLKTTTSTPIDLRLLPTSIIDLSITPNPCGECNQSLSGIERLTSLYRLRLNHIGFQWVENKCDWKHRDTWHNIFPKSMRVLHVGDWEFSSWGKLCPIRCNFKYKGLIVQTDLSEYNVNNSEYLDVTNYDFSDTAGVARLMNGFNRVQNGVRFDYSAPMPVHTFSMPATLLELWKSD
jgi:hypothetical protein